MSIEARLIRAGAAIAVLVLILMLVMSFWGNYRSAMSPAEERETTPTPEVTATPEPEAQTPTAQTQAQAPPASKGTVVVLIDGLNFRSAPQRDADLIRGLGEGEKLQYMETQDGWYKVKATDGTVGWVSASEQYTRLDQ